MFRILYSHQVIGHTQFEAGDAPMGCAAGIFHPAEIFNDFCANAAPVKDQDPHMKRWIGLSATTPSECLIPCVDVVLIEAKLKDFHELEIQILGIDNALYRQLFPQHVQAYKDQFS